MRARFKREAQTVEGRLISMEPREWRLSGDTILFDRKFETLDRSTFWTKLCGGPHF